MHQDISRGLIRAPLKKSDYVHNKKVTAVAQELENLEKNILGSRFELTGKIFNHEALNDLIVAGVLSPYDP